VNATEGKGGVRLVLACAKGVLRDRLKASGFTTATNNNVATGALSESGVFFMSIEDAISGKMPLPSLTDIEEAAKIASHSSKKAGKSIRDLSSDSEKQIFSLGETIEDQTSPGGLPVGDDSTNPLITRERRKSQDGQFVEVSSKLSPSRKKRQSEDYSSIPTSDEIGYDFDL
jgi:hypothetical protein